jgi:hypothetical protein
VKARLGGAGKSADARRAASALRSGAHAECECRLRIHLLRAAGAGERALCLERANEGVPPPVGRGDQGRLEDVLR